jgi:hypothetical protein
MKETVVYIRVPASQVPEELAWYYTDNGRAIYQKGSWVEVESGEDNFIEPTYYLQETPLSSLLQEGAVEFTEWISDNAWRKWPMADNTKKAMWYNIDIRLKDNKMPLLKSGDELFKLFIEDKYGKETK